MHASTRVRQSVIKARTLPNTSPKRTISTPIDVSFSPSRLDATSWSTTRSHPAQPEQKAHVPLIEASESSASPPSSPRTCICSPTTHKGSFRCRLHRDTQKRWPPATAGSTSPAKAYLEDDISVGNRVDSTEGLRVPRVHARGVPAIPRNETSPNLSAGDSGSSRIPTRGAPAFTRSATTPDLSSMSSMKSPTKTSRLNRMVSAENLLEIGKAEGVYEERDFD